MTREENVLENTTSSIKKQENYDSIDEINVLISTLSLKQKYFDNNEKVNRNNQQDNLICLKNEEYDEDSTVLNAEKSPPKTVFCTANRCQSEKSNYDAGLDNSFNKTTFSLDEDSSDEPSKLNLESDEDAEDCYSKTVSYFETSNCDDAKSEDSESEEESSDKSGQTSNESDSGAPDDSNKSVRCASDSKDETCLSANLSQLYIHDESEDEEKEEFVTRGPLTDNKNHSSRWNRYSPMHPYPMISDDNSHGLNHHRSSISPIHENNHSASLFDSNYRQYSTGDVHSQDFGHSQPFNNFGSTDMYANSCQLSPESLHSNSSPFYSSSFSLSENSNAFEYQTEDTSNNFGGNAFCETEDLKEEDLINVINSVNRTSKTETKDIPETQTELSILQNVLEGNEYSKRDELDMYLKNEEACFQIFLEDINGIKRDEMNIYMGEEKSGCDPSYATKMMHARCRPNSLDHALRKLSSLSLKALCDKDSDGDTCLMIVYSKDQESPNFYENIFCLQERVREIRVCCDAPLGKGKRCKLCGNTDPAKFYTPLSFKNNVGDTALSCAVKKEHPQFIVDYLLQGILLCKEDFRRVFDENGRQMLMGICYNYPSLWNYVMDQPGPA